MCTGESKLDLELVVLLRTLDNEQRSVPYRTFPMFRSEHFYRRIDGVYDVFFLGYRVCRKSRSHLVDVLSANTLSYAEMLAGGHAFKEAMAILFRTWRPAVFAYAATDGARPYPTSGNWKDVDRWLSEVGESMGVFSQLEAISCGVPIEDVLA